MSSSLFASKHRLAFVNFGGGRANHRRAALRLSRQADHTNLFSHVSVTTDRTLRSDFPLFWSSHKSVFRRAVPGFGWWIWKPFLISQALRHAGAQVVCYLDSGSVLNVNTESVKRLTDYFGIAMDTGGLAFRLPGQVESKWTKAATARVLDATHADMNTEQIAACALLLRNDRRSMELVDEWLDIAVRDDYLYVNGTIDGSDLDSDLIEPRHDQSIWSLLVKHSTMAVIDDKTFFSPDWNRGKGFPFWTLRHRSGTPPFSSSPRSRLIRRVEQLIP